MGEAKKEGLRLRFDRRLRLQFHGARITSDAGLRACRELMEDFMPIRVRHPDKNSPSTQQPEISLVMLEAMLFSQASYTAIDTVFGVLCGSI